MKSLFTSRFLLPLLLCCATGWSQSAGITAVTVTGTTPQLVANAGVTIFLWTLTASVGSSTFSSPAVGVGAVELCEDATGGWSAAFPANFVNFKPLVSTAANTCQFYWWEFDGTNVTAINDIVNVPRWGSCIVDNDSQSATALIAANFSGACQIPAAATITEVDVWGGTGVVGSPTTTGTGSINIQKFSPNGGGTTTLLSGALATVSGYACALTTTSGTCVNGTTSSGSITVSTTALSAGDWVRVSAATPDAAQTWYRVSVTYTFN